MKCAIVGVGAWGPGFNNWKELNGLLQSEHDVETCLATPPKPTIIPPNERRRAPLPVKISVEVSSQALAQSGFDAKDVACAFGSGLGDTDITDYMCRTLATDHIQLSPTKFHNSVHNAAAGYWTISTGCTKSATSIAAYYDTAGLCLLEAMSQCCLHEEPMLVTLFDTSANKAYKSIFSTRESFGAALLLCPLSIIGNKHALATLRIDASSWNKKSKIPAAEFSVASLLTLYQSNPAARVLPLLQCLSGKNNDQKKCEFSLSEHASIRVDVLKGQR